MRQLLEAGVHFGHQTKRWNPKMRPYIYGARNGIHIIDLQHTVRLFRQAYRFVAETVANGHVVLFIGTKKQAQDVVAEESARAGMFYVTTRWLGGTLTNWRTIKQTIDRLLSIEKMRTDGTFERIPKKEALHLDREAAKLEKNLKGIKSMPNLPGAVFVVDPNHELNAVREARRLEIPVVAVTDTNCDPDLVDYPIPGNDDAIRAVKLFTQKIADACMLGKRFQQERANNAAEREREREREVRSEPETIRVSSGGAGPKVEVVTRRGSRPEPEASSGPDTEK
ncbi:MAG: 30S ribosomal protein S2 [Myxococcota bacterium]